MVRIEDRIKAQNLRKQGKTYAEIRAIIPNLSKGTLCTWVKNIELTPQQNNRIIEKIRNSADRARALQRQRGGWTNHKNRILQTQQVILEAKEEINKLSSDSIFLMGLMLYWAEGDKSLDRQSVKFCNSDPLMIQFMMGWFRNYCKVPNDKFYIELNLHELLDKTRLTQYWSEISGVKQERFRIFIKPTSYSSLKNPSYQGTCSIRIHNVSLFRRIMTWRISLLEKIGYDVSNAPVAQWIEQMFSKH